MTTTASETKPDAIINAENTNELNGAVKTDVDVEILHPSLTVRTKEKPDPESLGLQEELPGWHGYLEWEKYPERKKLVQEYMKQFEFPGVRHPVFSN